MGESYSAGPESEHSSLVEYKQALALADEEFERVKRAKLEEEKSKKGVTEGKQDTRERSNRASAAASRAKLLFLVRDLEERTGRLEYERNNALSEIQYLKGELGRVTGAQYVSTPFSHAPPTKPPAPAEDVQDLVDSTSLAVTNWKQLGQGGPTGALSGTLLTRNRKLSNDEGISEFQRQIPPQQLQSQQHIPHVQHQSQQILQQARKQGLEDVLTAESQSREAVDLQHQQPYQGEQRQGLRQQPDPQYTNEPGAVRLAPLRERDWSPRGPESPVVPSHLKGQADIDTLHVQQSHDHEQRQSGRQQQEQQQRVGQAIIAQQGASVPVNFLHVGSYSRQDALPGSSDAFLASAGVGSSSIGPYSLQTTSIGAGPDPEEGPEIHQGSTNPQACHSIFSTFPSATSSQLAHQQQRQPDQQAPHEVPHLLSQQLPHHVSQQRPELENRSQQHQIHWQQQRPPMQQRLQRPSQDEKRGTD